MKQSGGFPLSERAVANEHSAIRRFEIDVARTAEGVWTATSQVIPGLNIEGDTFEEAVAEARLWAPELLRANNIVAEQERYRLVFCAPATPPLAD
jgi:predicted RNase H-like HicB family nuclease